MGISTEYSSTVDHMNCSKTMVSGEQVLHLFLNRRPAELLKDDGILMQQMHFSESLKIPEVGGSVWEPESHTPQLWITWKSQRRWYLEVKGLFFCKNRPTVRVLLESFWWISKTFYCHSKWGNCETHWVCFFVEKREEDGFSKWAFYALMAMLMVSGKMD